MKRDSGSDRLSPEQAASVPKTICAHRTKTGGKQRVNQEVDEGITRDGTHPIHRSLSTGGDELD